jgi:hypothetical protein
LTTKRLTKNSRLCKSPYLSGEESPLIAADTGIGTFLRAKKVLGTLLIVSPDPRNNLLLEKVGETSVWAFA